MAQVIFKDGVKSLFVYGSLRVPEIREALLGEEKEQIDLVRLEGHRAFRLQQRRYPALLPDAGSTTEGTLIIGELSEYDWKILDAFEDEYIRKPVTVLVPDPNGAPNGLRPVEAYTYMWPDPEDRMIRREGVRWTLESFINRREAFEDFLENTIKFRELFLQDGSASSGPDAGEEEDGPLARPSFVVDDDNFA